MAIIWQKRVNNKLYEVRRAGNSLRLYTNGIFHSQYNPRNTLSGDLWEMMCLPFLLAAQTMEIKKVLLLGVGGGAVIRNLLEFDPNLQITGVDIDKQHLLIAKRNFGLAGKCQLYLDDAVAWVSANSDAKFDLIIDDLFGEEWSEEHCTYLPKRAVEADSGWQSKLLKVLAPKGILVFNMESKSQAQKLKRQELLKSKFTQQVNFTSPRYENCIAACYPFSKKGAEVKQILLGHSAVGKLLDKQPDAFHVFCGKFPTR